MERRPLRRRNTLAIRRQPATRRRRIDLDAYYRAEQDDDIYHTETAETTPIELPREVA
jgi:hypothetical protein